MSYPRAGEPLPAPLPPETRTVGQLIAETIRLFGSRFWLALPLGLAIASLDALSWKRSPGAQFALQYAFAPVLTAAFVWASVLVAPERPPRRAVASAFAAGLVVFLPFPVLLRLYVLPGFALFALAGLAVPAAIVERLGLRAALRRGVQLGRADFVHALGGLAALAIVYGLSRSTLLLVLRTQGDQAEQVAGFLADLALAPLLFLGAALLYVDQAARAS